MAEETQVAAVVAVDTVVVAEETQAVAAVIPAVETVADTVVKHEARITSQVKIQAKATKVVNHNLDRETVVRKAVTVGKIESKSILLL